MNGKLPPTDAMQRRVLALDQLPERSDPARMRIATDWQKPLSTDLEKQLEVLARQIAGDSDDIATLTLARVAAEAQLQLPRVKQVKKALIERAMVFGRLDSPSYFRSELAEMRWLLAEIEWREGKRLFRLPAPVVLNPSAPLPEDESERATEAARRILSDLARLGRYESRAAGRRDRAIVP